MAPLFVQILKIRTPLILGGRKLCTYSDQNDRYGELCYDFSISNDLTQMVNFFTQIPDWFSQLCPFGSIYFLMLVFVLQWLSLHWEIMIMLLSQLPLTFHHIHIGMPCFIQLLMTILVLTGMVFVIFWEMFHGKISLNSVLMLLLVNFVNRFTLELMYISLIKNIRLSLTHLHGFWLLVLLP